LAPRPRKRRGPSWVFVTTEGIATPCQTTTNGLFEKRHAGGRWRSAGGGGGRLGAGLPARLFPNRAVLRAPLSSIPYKSQKIPARAVEVFYGLQRRQPNCFPLRFCGLRLKSAHRNSAFKFIYFGRKNGYDGVNWEP
jgi:hypothetical protein